MIVLQTETRAFEFVKLYGFVEIHSLTLSFTRRCLVPGPTAVTDPVHIATFTVGYYSAGRVRIILAEHSSTRYYGFSDRLQRLEVLPTTYSRMEVTMAHKINRARACELRPAAQSISLTLGPSSSAQRELASSSTNESSPSSSGGGESPVRPGEIGGDERKTDEKMLVESGGGSWLAREPRLRSAAPFCGRSSLLASLEVGGGGGGMSLSFGGGGRRSSRE